MLFSGAMTTSVSVLVVDDEKLMMSVMTRILERLGYTDVEGASDALTALAMMRGKRYGLVICDWIMEPISGYDMLRHIRTDPDLRHVPFIMTTTETVMQKAIAAKTAGVSGYLTKPFSPGTLQRTIDAVLTPVGRAVPPAAAPAAAGAASSPNARLWSRD
jgi:two-component system chemotaxis response regulator CheY